ncbi:MFS transporter [Acidimicrobium ferrooxidans]|nr:MFS transporter [Acidimicrobium ferrooxidans]
MTRAQMAGGRGERRGFADARAALRVRRFSAWWVAQLLSGIGSWAQAVAIPWYVLERTGSASAVGIVTTLQFLPVLVLSLFGGAIADRVSRRGLLLVTQLLLAFWAAMLGFLVASHEAPIWVVDILALAIGATNAINNPTQQAFLPELVPRELLAPAIALNSVQFNAARMIGGAVGGALIAALGVAAALWVNAVSFLPVVAVLILIASHSARAVRRERPAGSMLSELGSGLRFVIGAAPVRSVVLVFGFVGLFGFNWQVAVPLVARFALHEHANGLGLLMGALGAGALVASLLASALGQATQRRLVVAGTALGLSLIGLGLARSMLVAGLLLVAGGFFGVLASVSANTRLQMLAPPTLRGRVMAIYVLLMGGTTPVGAFVLGELASWLGSAWAVLVFGVATAAGVVAASLWGRQRSGSSGQRAATAPID